MNPKVKYSLVAVLFIAGGYLLYKRYMKDSTPEKNSKKDTENEKTKTEVTPPIITPPVVQNTAGFPLKVKSRGNNVIALQRILGVKVDGIFGSETLKALQSLSGKSSVDSLAELNALREKKIGILSSMIPTRADKLISDYNGNSNLKISTIKSTLFQPISIDYQGAIRNSGTPITIPAGTTFDRDDASPLKTTNSGLMVLKMNTLYSVSFLPAIYMTYTANANDLTLI